MLLQRGIWPSGHLVIRVMFKVAANVSTARLHGGDIDPKTKTGAEFKEQLRILFKNGVNTWSKNCQRRLQYFVWRMEQNTSRHIDMYLYFIPV